VVPDVWTPALESLSVRDGADGADVSTLTTVVSDVVLPTLSVPART
jgi:hypothetical protein